MESLKPEAPMLSAHKNVRILLSLLKQYGIAHMVVSPGSRNMSVVRSAADDPFFRCYSVVDERSAAYFAVGLSLELRQPVAITCTSAQAVRNYMPGLTEAFYRKAPVLAIACGYDASYTDQMVMQAIHQESLPSDAANVAVDVPIVKDALDGQLATKRINEALDALSRRGGGPAFINLRIEQLWTKGPDQLEEARKVTRHTALDSAWPAIEGRKVVVLAGAHHPFEPREQALIARFAEAYDAAVFTSHLSNYHGARAILGGRAILAGGWGELKPDLVITFGGSPGDYVLHGALRNRGIETWRVAEDGQAADPYNTLTRIFECPEPWFFDRMAGAAGDSRDGYFDAWRKRDVAPEVPAGAPLSHALVAQQLAGRLPEGSNLHLAIRTALRTWELFDLAPSIRCYSNVAGYGIDGCVSTFLGQCAASDRPGFLITGDLAFFYDLNALGIRGHKGNVHIVLINNGGGAEFQMFNHCARSWGDVGLRYVSAAGHFGGQAGGESGSAAAAWARSNSFLYSSARSAGDLPGAIAEFLDPANRPRLLEVFTNAADDSKALESLMFGKRGRDGVS